MKTLKILYIHGYKGSASGASFKNLKKAFGDKVELIGVDYDEKNFFTAMNSIMYAVEKERPDFIIGSSLGGYLTLNIPTNIKKIVINPCLYPQAELKYLGAEDEFIDTFRNRVYSHVTEYDNVVGVFGNKDELLGLKYLEEFDELYGYTYIVDSGHQISYKGACFINELLTSHFCIIW